MKKRVGKEIKFRKKNPKVLILSLLAVYFFAFLGSLFTSKTVNSAWYDSIRVSLTPPNWVFPIVWNILFLLIALSLYYAWTSSKSKKDKKKIIIVFGVNLFLNAFWSLLFFALKNTKLAFFELIVLLASISSMIFVAGKINRKSSWLLVPYALWVSFAGILNGLIAFG